MAGGSRGGDLSESLSHLSHGGGAGSHGRGTRGRGS